MKRAAFVIYDKFEELEAVAPIDILRRAGVDVKILTLSGDLETVGRSSISIKADAKLCDFKGEIFDCLAISGGPGFKEAVKSELLLEFIKAHAESGKILAAICAAPFILKTAGVLEGRRCTAHPSVFDKMGELATPESVVCDGKTITSNGAGSAVLFGLKIVEMLLSQEEAKKVSDAICFKE